MIFYCQQSAWQTDIDARPTAERLRDQIVIF